MTLLTTTKTIKDKIALLTGKPWMEYVWLIMITLLAAALRFYKLDAWSFWIDEIYTIDHATSHFRTPELILSHIPPNRYWLPISVIFSAQMLNNLGINEWSARLVSAVIGVLTIPILYMPLRKILDRPYSLIAMLLLAVSPWHIFWSQNARFYTSLLLFYSLALFVFYFALERDRPIYFVLFYGLFYLAMSERIIAVVLLPVVAVYLLLLWLLPFERPVGLKIQNVLILFLPVFAFLVYEVYLFSSTGNFIFASDLDLLAPPIDTPIRLLIIVAFSLGLPLVCLAFLNGIYLFREKERAGLFFLIAAFLPTLLVAMANPFVFTVERYVFMTLLFWVVLATRTLKILFERVGKDARILGVGILFVLLADAAGAGLMYYQINHGDRLDWREAVRYVQDRKQDGDVVVSTRAPLASYYLGENVLEFRELSPADFERIQSRIWFIIDHPGIWHGSGLGKAWLENHARLVQFSYLRVREYNFMLIYIFDPAQDTNP